MQVGERLRVLPGDETTVVKGQFSLMFSPNNSTLGLTAGRSRRDGDGQGTVGCGRIQRDPVPNCD